MKRLSLIPALACAALLPGCDGASDPAAPPPEPVTWTEPYTPPPYSGASNLSIAGFVIDPGESCIIGARVEVIDGPRKGDSVVQTKCGFWDYGADIGYVFNGLPRTTVTLRATADGYHTVDKVASPTNPYQYTTYIVLTRNQ